MSHFRLADDENRHLKENGRASRVFQAQRDRAGTRPARAGAHRDGLPPVINEDSLEINDLEHVRFGKPLHVFPEYAVAPAFGDGNRSVNLLPKRHIPRE